MIKVYREISKVDILAIGVHPDDIDLCCSGTVLKHIHMGYKVGYCDLTRGEMGTRGNAKLRLEESELAAQIVDVDFRVNLEMKDAFFMNDTENVSKIARIVRLCTPKIVLANAIRDRHPDHGRASKLISDACFYSGLRKFELEGTQAHRPKSVYHYVQDRYVKPDFVVDISEHIEVKMDSIKAFKSQFFDKNSKEPVTPISVKNFLDYIKSKNRIAGRHIGVEYAEPFTTERPVGISNMCDLG